MQKKYKFEERIKELYGQGKIQAEIARELNVNYSTISRYMKKLEEQGEIQRKTISDIVQERREKVKELCKQGKTKKEIAKELNVSYSTILLDIGQLREQGEIQEKKISDIVQERRKRVKELYEKGKTTRKIAKELNVNETTILHDIKYLRKQGKIREKKVSDVVQERRRRVKELYEQGKTQTEIVQELNVSHSTISNDIKYLRKQGEVQEKKVSDVVRERRRRVKELYAQGKKQREIAKELNVSDTTISNDIKCLRKPGELQEKEISDIVQEKQLKEQREIQGKGKKLDLAQIQKLCEDFYGQKSILEKFRIYMSDCKQRFMQGNLENEEVSVIKNIAELTGEYQDVIFSLKTCVKVGRIKEAIRFANSQVQNETFTKEEKEKMKQFRSEIEEISKEYIAMQVLRKGEGVKKAIDSSGLSQVKVLMLNRKLLNQNKKEKEAKTENEDNDEPNL